MVQLDDVGQLIRERGSTLSSEVHGRLFEAIPETRQLFPADMGRAHTQLPRALAWVLENADENGLLCDDVIAQIHTLARDHRRHGFPSDIYDLFGLLLGDAFVETVGDDLPQETINHVVRLIGLVCSELSIATSEDELKGIPPAYAAHITHIENHGEEVKVLKLEAGTPVDYSAGDLVPVKPSEQQGGWMCLAPALPPNPFGHLEFHVPQKVPASVGDYWTIGSPRTGITSTEGRDKLLICAGTGLSIMKSLVFDLLAQSERPNVHLMITADSPAGLYELTTFAALAQANDWLTVTPVVDGPASIENPPTTAGITPVTVPVEILLSGAGLWWDREILIAGPDDAIEPIHLALLDAGAPNEDIRLCSPHGHDMWAREDDPF
ncbi:hypothetical protein QP027_10120 [Corynebacterium breve]|uniref:2-polyprenylphenol hydroxylase n=1 Tax=Corynebacterium breve TaxID=3049799 RepID=A0ABY8VIR5_9CORY|nr:hypothetical protein [Corynebacterium breve]WIM67445.1 hypothetical protein QP027_10120 [Corynebacterium breve]